mmetsp:Transcript_125535/g.287612  ORF Transcript_125535/g.287612 Transcript_125535/m.287612 type:complete len:411 (+) Transcript_125535:414-1646(+)
MGASWFSMCMCRMPEVGTTVFLFKVKFMRAVRRCMQEQRKLGKRVLLCGDINIAPRAVDNHRSGRWVHVEEALGKVADPSLHPTLAQLLKNIKECWPAVKYSLENTIEIGHEFINASSGQSATKYRVLATTKDGVQVKLGRPYGVVGRDHPPTHAYSMKESRIFGDAGQGEELFSLRRAGGLRVMELREACEKLAGLSDPSEAWEMLSDECGQVANCFGANFLQQMYDEDGLCDAFAEARPNAKGRFTIWDQSVNNRYINVGSRIDLFVLDRQWWEAEGVVGGDLAGTMDGDGDSWAAARRGCTAFGGFQPAPYGGGGIPEAPQSAYEAMFMSPHTGILYTSPEASDHVAVSLCLRSTANGSSLELAKDAATKSAQPHKRQSSIMNFFGAGVKRSVSSTDQEQAAKKASQ